MAKDFFKKLVLGVAISLTSVAVLSGFTALSKVIRGDDEASVSENSSLEYCVHTGVIEISGKAPTCEMEGWTDGSICATCHGIIKEQEYIPPLGHTYEVRPRIEATCLETGLTEGIYCVVCNNVRNAQEVIPALGHNIVDNSCDRCGFDVSEMTLVEVEVVSGEKIAGNWYRIYKPSIDGDPRDVGLTISGHFFLYYTTSGNPYYTSPPGNVNGLDETHIVRTDTYVDVYIPLHLTVTFGGLVEDITITENTTATVGSKANVKRLMYV